MIYDVVIVGGGPAGLSAAIYASRARLKALVVESLTMRGQAVIASDIENYPGFPEAINGFSLLGRFKKQAEKFGAEFKACDVKSIKEYAPRGKKTYQIESNEGPLTSLSVILATGACPTKLGVSGEDKFSGKGVSYCAVCDAAFFKDKNIAVVGGGDTAIEEALFLTKFARKVTLIHRKDRLRATKILQERAFANKKIEFIWNSVVREIVGQNRVEALRVMNTKDRTQTDFLCDGVFIFIGYTPNTDFLKGVVELDENGYVIADDNMKTSKEGIFVCGDVRRKLLRQVVTACGDGATAAVSARKYVEELKGIAYK